MIQFKGSRIVLTEADIANDRFGWPWGKLIESRHADRDKTPARPTD